MMQAVAMKKPAAAEANGYAYCPICTHTVSATVIPVRRGHVVKPGQKCPRCASTLDPAVVVQVDQAA